jgi:succinate dehydrogenase/fumarate reductase cytochrome b subunit
MYFQLFPIAEASVGTLMKSINRVILNPLILFLFALALAYFLYGVMQFIINPGNEEIRKTGKSHMMWGVVGMVIMVSVFGIMQLIVNTIGEKSIRIDSTGDYEVNKLER